MKDLLEKIVSAHNYFLTQQALVAVNRELITRFGQKIQATLVRIWGEEKPRT